MSTTDKENSSDLTEKDDTKEIMESVKIEDTADATQKENTKKDSFFCPISKLLLSADALIKENEKSHNLRKHDISINEAKNYLLQILSIMSLETLDPNMSIGFAHPVVLRGWSHKSDPTGMIQILHHTLLTSSQSQLSLKRSQKPSKTFTLTSKGPLPEHIFPYEMLVHHCLPFLLPFIIRDEILNEKIFCRTVLFNIVPLKGKLFSPQSERKRLTEKMLDPDTQFMDLKDLQRKFYKGILKWKQKSRIIFKAAPVITEKAFVPEMISINYTPCLVYKPVKCPDKCKT